MIMKLMTGPLGLVVVALLMWWGITFNRRLEAKYGCTAFRFGGVAAGFAGSFCWVLALGHSGSGGERFIAGVVALVITLLLFASNRKKAGYTYPGITMTIWQLTVGLIVFLILGALSSRKRD